MEAPDLQTRSDRIAELSVRWCETEESKFTEELDNLINRLVDRSLDAIAEEIARTETLQ